MSAHILRQLREFIYPGEGFLRVKEIPLQSVHLASSGLLLGAPVAFVAADPDADPPVAEVPGAPGFGVTNTNTVIIQWTSSVVTAAGLSVQVPDDYDETMDHLKLKLKAASAGGTDSPAITVAAYKDSAPTVDLAPAATEAAGTESAWLEVDLSGRRLVAGDVLQLKLTPGAHTTDALNVYAIKVEYRSSLVYNDQTQPR